MLNNKKGVTDCATSVAGSVKSSMKGVRVHAEKIYVLI